MERFSDLSSVKDIVSGRTLFDLLLTTMEAVTLNSGGLRRASSLPTCKPLGCEQGTYWVLEGMCVCTWVCCYLRGGGNSGRFLEFPSVAKILFTFRVKYKHLRSAVSFFNLQNFCNLESGEFSLFTHFCHVFRLNSLDSY